MFENWEIIGLGIVGLGLLVLIASTVSEIIHRRKNRRRKPQDHYFAERKKRDG